MRCSECFGEMQEGPNGLYCKACGTSLAPVSDEAQASPKPPKQPGKSSRLSWVFAILLPVLMILTGVVAIPLLSSEDLFEQAEAPVEIEAPQFLVADDPSGLVVSERALPKDPGVLHVFAEPRCQSVAGEASEAKGDIIWMAADLSVEYALSPGLPGNWQLSQLCRERSGRVFFAANVANGTMIGELSPEGAIIWTQAIPRTETAPRDMKLYLSGPHLRLLLPVSEDRISLSSFALDGDLLWTRTLDRPDAEADLHLTDNLIGEAIVAWEEATSDAGTVLRVITLSPLNALVSDRIYENRPGALEYMAGDDVAGLGLLEGNEGIALTQLDGLGEVSWSAAIDERASPIGFAQGEMEYVVAGHSGSQIKLWRVQYDGSIIGTADIALRAAFKPTGFHQSRNGDFLISLETEMGNRMQIRVDRTRLVETTQAQLATVATPGPADTPTLDELIAETSEVLDRSETIDELPSIEPSPAPSRANDDPPVSVSPAPAQAEAPERTESLVEPQPPVAARCQFECVANDGSELIYALTQVIDIEPERSAAEPSADLHNTHKKLCQLSGGVVQEPSGRVCSAQ